MKTITLGGRNIAAGESLDFDLPVAKLYTDTEVSMPIQVRRAKKPGPILFVSSAIHGDELNGVEIIRRLLAHKRLRMVRGTLIAVPMVNVQGVLNQSRYLPDRRDLNRSFPGSAGGSLAARVAHQFLNEVVKLCDYGIDLHTGAIHRSNLPQLRANLDDAETLELASVFGVPVMLNSQLRDGSLRQAAMDLDVKTLLYEAGEALRFDELSIRAGVNGILNVLSHLGMIRKAKKRSEKLAPYVANHSAWVRASCSGVVQNLKSLGDKVEKEEVLANIFNPFGQLMGRVIAPRDGIIIGEQRIPLAQEGEAMFHLAYFRSLTDVAENIEILQDTLLPPANDPAEPGENYF